MDYVINKYEIALKKYNNKSIYEVKWGARIRNNQAMSLITQDDVINMADKILGLWNLINNGAGWLWFQ